MRYEIRKSATAEARWFLVRHADDGTRRVMGIRNLYHLKYQDVRRLYRIELSGK